jgi:cbb3-type cytochrome oxidase subunit 3
MRSSIQFEDWHATIQVIAFTLIFLAFCFFTIKTLLMKKERAQQLAAMPLRDQEDSEKPTSTKLPKE